MAVSPLCGWVCLQVGISDSWVQLSHLLKVFGGRELTPPVVAAMWKRLAGRGVWLLCPGVGGGGVTTACAGTAVQGWIERHRRCWLHVVR